MDAALRRRLTDALDRDAVASDGHAVAPSSTEHVAAAVRLLAAGEQHVHVVSGPAEGRKTGLTLSLHRLDAIELSAAGLTVRAGAGVPLDAFGAALAEARLEVTGMPRRPAATHVGSLVAEGALPSRSICGVEAVLPNGAIVRAGGPVLKDVAGYAIAALLAGSAGRLAVITAVTFRLAPAGAALPVGPPAGKRRSSRLAPVLDPAGLLR